MSKETAPCDRQNVWWQTDLREAFLFCKHGNDICKVHKASPGSVQECFLYPTTFAFYAVPSLTQNVRNLHALVIYYLNMLFMKPISVFGGVPQQIDAETEIRVQKDYWRIMPVREWGKQDRGSLALMGSSSGHIEARGLDLYFVPSLTSQGQGT